MRNWFIAGHLDPVAIISNTPAPFDTAAAVQAWTASPSEAPAAIPGAILIAGRGFFYDAADTTSVHDGVWIAVSADGRRYRSADLPLVTSVVSATVTTPPTINSSVYGKGWIVPPAATGAWASQSGNIAIATGRGWVFTPPRLGLAVYIADVSLYAHFDEFGSWVQGLGTPSVGTVDPTALAWPFGVAVENRTTNAPPTGAFRRAYIVGPAPTGAWAGRTGQVAIGPSGGWSYITPPNGAEVYCSAEATRLRYSSGAWSSSAGSLSNIRFAADISSLTLTGNSYSYAFATAPTAANTAASGLSLTHAARASGNLLQIRFTFATAVGAAGTGAVGLFVDGAGTASQWLPISCSSTGVYTVEFLVTVTDALSHTYACRFGSVITAPTKRQMTLEEMSVLT